MLAEIANPWHWHWIHAPVIEQIYHTIAWTWGGAGQGGQTSEAYGAFSSSIPCLALISILANWWHSRNCHEHRCWRLAKHSFRDPDTGEEFKLCKKHHPALKPKKHWWSRRKVHDLKYMHERYWTAREGSDRVL